MEARRYARPGATPSRLAALGAALCLACAPAPPDAPNLLLVTVDTLRADHVGAYGAESAGTPTMDALAREGALFERAFSPAPLTLPSHVTLLTGRQPPRHGVRHNGLHHLGDGIPTLAEQLAARGYATGAVVGAFVLAADTGIGRGFDHYDDEARSHTHASGFLERPAAAVVDRAIAWLDDVDTDARPFFLWVHFYDPHRDWRAPEPFASRFRERPYQGEIAYSDAQLARLLDALASRGLAERTLVALTSDHGESLGEHGEDSHGYTLYDASLHVPLLLRGPGVPAGRRVEAVTGLVDLAPTLLQLLGAPPLPESDGESLVVLLDPQAGTPERVAYSETLATRLDHGWAPVFSLRTGTHRSVRAPTPELYDLRNDPGERHNLLSEAEGGEPQALYAELDARVDRVRVQAVPSRTREIDASARERLEALGYAVRNDAPAANDMDFKQGLPLLRRYQDAKILLDAGRAAEAAALLAELAPLLPESAAVHSHLGRALAYSGRVAEGWRHARRAVDLVPESADYRAALAMIEVQRGRRSTARNEFERALAANPNLASVQAGAMWVAATRGDLEAAAQHEANALSLAGEGWRVHQWLAALWTEQGHPDRALAVLERAPEDPTNTEPLHLERALLLLRLARFDEAEILLATIPMLADQPAAANRIAIAYAQAGRPDQAVAMFESLIKRAPDFEPARRNLESLRKHLSTAPAAPQR